LLAPCELRTTYAADQAALAGNGKIRESAFFAAKSEPVMFFWRNLVQPV
jgi:hypothetical protein